jgi:exosortase
MLLGAYTIVLLAANAGILADLITVARTNHTSSHVVLAPFVTAVLLYWQRASIAGARRPDWASGLGLIALGGLLLVLGRSSFWGREDALSASVAGVVVLWLGGFLAAFGRSAFRTALFPLLFLLVAVPPPTVVVAPLTALLKRGSTEITAVLFTLTGTPYFRQDFVFSLPGFNIEVADECSGIRSSIALMLTGLVASHMFLQRSWSKGLLLLAIVPIAILKNGIRIVSLSLLAMHVDPAFLEGQLHHEGGVVFLLLALVLLAPLLPLLRRLEAGGGAAGRLDARTPA